MLRWSYWCRCLKLVSWKKALKLKFFIFVYNNRVSMITASALECYVCANQSDNTQKCLNTIKTCEPDEDVCKTEIRWGKKFGSFRAAADSLSWFFIFQAQLLTGISVPQNNFTSPKAVQPRKSASQSDPSTCLTALTSGTKIGLVLSVVLEIDATIML